MSMSARLREFFKAVGVTQALVARAYGRSAQQVNNTLQNGRLSHDFATWLAEVALVNINWLLTGNGPMLVPPDSLQIAESPPTYEGQPSDQLILEGLSRRRLRNAAADNASSGTAQGEATESAHRTLDSPKDIAKG